MYEHSRFTVREYNARPHSALRPSGRPPMRHEDPDPVIETPKVRILVRDGKPLCVEGRKLLERFVHGNK